MNSSGKFKTSNGSIGLPYHGSQGSNCQLRGQNCYVEVTIGVPSNGRDKALQSNSNSVRTFPKHQVVDSPALERSIQKGSFDTSSVSERTFIYPAEAVLVPILQTSFARSSLKRYRIYVSVDHCCSFFYQDQVLVWPVKVLNPVQILRHDCIATNARIVILQVLATKLDRAPLDWFFFLHALVSMFSSYISVFIHSCYLKLAFYCYSIGRLRKMLFPGFVNWMNIYQSCTE